MKGTGKMYDKKNSNGNDGLFDVSKARESLALFALVCSLLGNIYLGWSKPTADIQAINSELKIINYRLERIDKKIGL